MPELPSDSRAERTAFVTSQSDDHLIADLIDLPMAEREGYLNRTCGNDTDLRQRVVGKLEQLLDSLSTPGPLSQTPARSSRSRSRGERRRMACSTRSN